MRSASIKKTSSRIVTACLAGTLICLALGCASGEPSQDTGNIPRKEAPPTGERTSEEIKSNIQESLNTRQKVRETGQTAVARGRETAQAPPSPSPTELRATPTSKESPTESPTRAPVHSPSPTPEIPPTESGGEQTQIPPEKPTASPVPAQTQPAPTPTPTPIATIPARTAASEVYRLPWVRDGTTNQERETLDHLAELARYSPNLARRLLKMPFLKTHQPTDAGAAGALNFLDYRDHSRAEEVVAHFEALGGITDEDTVSIALAYTQDLFGGSASEILLSQDLETRGRAVQLPQSGEVQITLVKRKTKPSEGVLDRIEETLAKLEKYFQVPVPTHNIIIHYGGTLPSGARSGNSFISITQEAGQDRVDQFHWTVHELVHYWFNSNESWLDEGIAQAVTSIVQSDGRPARIPTTSRNCPESARIETELDNLQWADPVASWCAYVLGERFMQVLYEEAGYEGFREGIGRLAKIGTTSPNRQMGIEQIKRAFQEHPEAVRKAAERWYHSAD